MHTNATATDVMVKLVPGGDGGLAHLSDSELLTSTRGLVGKSNQLFAALLAHLAEVEARGLHRTRACASLYTYCIYELRFSEDEAARRAGAAKLVKRFPLLLAAIANGELHLTGLLMLGPHFTSENVVEVLGRAKFRTKKELARLVRELHPLPLVADSIEPLGLEARALRKPTWQEFVSSLAPAVRELPPGDRPRDWANDDGENRVGIAMANNTARRRDSGAGRDLEAVAPVDGAGAPRAVTAFEASLPALARVESPRAQLPPITGPQQYQMQFSTTEEHVQLAERAKALLARHSPGKSLGELHLEAMRLLVGALEKQRFGAVERARKHAGAPVYPRQQSQRGRYVSAAVRRAVFERDAGRCSYVDERGERCRETHCLELHHRQPFADDGPHTVANLTLHCPAHNALAAEWDFGARHMAEQRDPWRHESCVAERRAIERSNNEATE